MSTSLRLVVARPTGDGDEEVLAQFGDDPTVQQLTTELAREFGVSDSLPIWVDGIQLEPDAMVNATSILQGSFVSFQGPYRAKRQPEQRGWQLRVVGGPAAGSIFSLPIGRHEVGRHGEIAVPDPAMSRVHAVIEVSADGATIADLGSTNGTWLDGERISESGQGHPVAVGLGQIIAVGDTCLSIEQASLSDAALREGEGGTLEFRRPPRIRPPTSEAVINLPAAPAEPRARKIPLFAIAIPLLLGVGMALLLKTKTYLLFALMSPLMAVGNVISDRRTATKNQRAEKRHYAEEMKMAQARLREALVSETAQRRLDSPDPATIHLTAVLPTSRLWERRRSDEDALVLRLGLGEDDAHVKLQGAGASGGQDSGEMRRLYSVPVTVSLRDVGVIGIVGEQASAFAVARWLLVQLCVLHAPGDVSIVLLSDVGRSAWTWSTWLPHLAPEDPDGPIAAVGNDAASVRSRVDELVDLVRVRKGVAEEGRSGHARFSAVVVFIDGAHELRGVPGLVQVLRDGPSVGVYAVCIESEARFLPEECNGVVSIGLEEPAELNLSVTGSTPVRGVLADQLSVAIAQAIAQSIAPIRSIATEEGELPLPSSARLLDILKLEPPTFDAIRSRWLLAGRTSVVQVGVSGRGTFEIDLRTDGPHALIAGTTGAGKSELLQSIIASLAASNRPESINFVLVDYKGGSAFKDCVRLPHTVGMVTDLDAHLVERALVSLGAELRRREHLLAAAGAKDIEDYQELIDRGESLVAMPRLVLVIDEFASMARELPDFVTGLVNIAQRGRSLGIHLILATQRPSGVVSPEIRANTNLRIALRVQDAADSQDVIESAEAAQISKATPGRALARTGAGSTMPFQAGRIGGRRPGASSVEAGAVKVMRLSWGELGYRAPSALDVPSRAEGMETDLVALVTSVCEAARLDGSPQQFRPWLEALPDEIVLTDIQTSKASDAIVFGLEDLPENQTQVPAVFSLQSGHLFIVGAPRSGRSQALRTFAGSAARSYSSSDLHMYALDCGSGGLLALSELPHCGVVVRREQTERAIRLLQRLVDEMRRRQLILAEGGFSNIEEQRDAADISDRMPQILFFLDRWEGFVTGLGEVDRGQPLDQVLQILREGPSVGVHVIASGDKSLAMGKVGSLCDNKLTLRLADRNDYVFLGLNSRKMPDDIAPGRAYRAESGVEVQIALLTRSSAGQAQAEALAAIGSSVASVPSTVQPFRIDELPASLSFEKLVESAGGLGDPLVCPVGVGGDQLTVMSVDFTCIPGMLVVGAPRSGRSTVLVNLAWWIGMNGGEVIVIAPRPSSLRSFGDMPWVRGIIEDPSLPSEDWGVLLDPDAARPKRVILVDDADDLQELSIGQKLSDVIKGRSSIADAVILAGRTGNVGRLGWQREFASLRQGVLLSPSEPRDGEVFGVSQLARSSLSESVRPGLGVICLGNAAPVQIRIADSPLTLENR